MAKKKAFIEVFITPIVIALVGIIGTYIITYKQIANTKELTRTQLLSAEKMSKSEQQIKLIEIFADKISSEKADDRKLAIDLLSFIDLDLSRKIIALFSDSSYTDTTIRNTATRIIQEKYSYVVIVGSFHNLDESRAFANMLNKKNVKHPLKIYKNELGIYAVCLGNNFTYTEAIEVRNYASESFRITDAYIRNSTNFEIVVY